MALNVTGYPLEFDAVINTGNLTASINTVSQNLNRLLSTPLEKAFEQIDKNLDSLLKSMRELGSDPALEKLFARYAELQKQQLSLQDTLQKTTNTGDIADLNAQLANTVKEIADINRQVQGIDLAGKIEGVRALIAQGSIGGDLATGFENAAKVVEHLTSKLQTLYQQKQNNPDGGLFLDRDIENTERFLDSAKLTLQTIADQILNLPKEILKTDVPVVIPVEVDKEKMDEQLQEPVVIPVEVDKKQLEEQVADPIVVPVEIDTSQVDQQVSDIFAGAEAIDFGKLEADIRGFTESGMEGAKQLATMLDGLIEREERLESAASRTMNPELSERYNKALQDTGRQITMVSTALDEMAGKGIIFDDQKQNKELEALIESYTRLRELNKQLEQEPATGKNLQARVQQARQLATIMDELIAQQERLEAAIKKASNPEEARQYKVELEETWQYINKVAADMDAIAAEGVVLDDFADNDKLEKTASIYSRLNQLKTEMAALPAGSEDFRIRQEEAVKLQTAIDGINRGIKVASTAEGKMRAITQGVRGLMGGFQALSGTMALFGADSEKTEEATKKVIGVMGILQGMEEISAILDKESAANIFLKSLAHTQNTAAVTAETVATEANAVAKNSATAAQWKLNAAMMANPVGVILGALVALYAAYEVYSRTIGKATDAEKERAAAIEVSNEVRDRSIDGYVEEEAAIRSLVSQASNELETRKQRQEALDELKGKYPGYLSNLSLENIAGEKGNEIISRQIELLKQKAIVQASEDLYAEKLKNQIRIQNEIDRLQAGGETTLAQRAKGMLSQGWVEDVRLTTIRNLQQELADATIQTNAAFDNQQKENQKLADSHLNTADKIKTYIRQLDLVIEKSNGFVQAIAKMARAGAEMQLKLEEANQPFDPEKFELEKTKILENAQYEINLNKNSFAGRKRLIQETYDLEIQRIEGLNTGDVEHDKKIAYGKYIAAINELNNEYRAKNYQSEVAAAEAVVTLMQAKGQDATEAFYNAREEVAKASARAQLAQEGITAGEIKRIHAQLALDLATIDKERIAARIEDHLASVRAQLASTKEGTREELALKVRAVAMQAEIELQQLSLTENKKQEIRRKAAKEISDLNRQFAFQELKDEENIRLSTNNALLVEVEKGSRAELELRKRLVDDKAALDVLSANESIKNEQLKLAKIAEINARALEDRRKLEAEFREKQLQDQLSAIEKTTAGKNATLDLVINDRTSSGYDIADAQRQKMENTIQGIRRQLSKLDAEIMATGDKEGKLALQYETLKRKLDASQKELKNFLESSKYNFLAKAADDINEITIGLQGMAQGFQGLDNELAEVGRTLEAVGRNAVVGLDSVKRMREAIDSKNTAGAVGAGLGVFGAFMGAVSAIDGFFKRAHQQREEMKRANEEMQDNVIVGEVAVNDEYRKRLLLQSQINKLKMDAIAAEAEALQQNSQSLLNDYNKILSEIQTRGKIALPEGYTAEEIKAAEEMAIWSPNNSYVIAFKEATSLMNKSYEDIEKLFLQGRLDESASRLFQTLKSLKEQGLDIDKALADNKAKADELFTGTTSNAILDSIVQGFAEGKRVTAEFADNFEQLMRNSILNAFKYKALEKPIQEFYESFAAAAESDGALTEAEILTLQAQYDKIIQNAGLQFEQLSKLSNVDFLSDAAQRNSLKGAIKGITEQQAELLAGQFGGLRITALNQLQVAQSSLMVLNNIENNTSRIAAVEAYLRRFDRDGIKIR